MEAKLKEYRARRRRNELIENTKQKLETTKTKLINFLVPKTFREMEHDKKEEEMILMEHEESAAIHSPEQFEEDVTSEVSELESFEEETPETWRCCIIKWLIITSLWLMFYIIFLKLQFGAVYFIISILIGIYLNTRTRPKKKGEVSAYSVFNKNCTSIDGTLKAEQFEREIRYGAGSVKVF